MAHQKRNRANRRRSLVNAIKQGNPRWQNLRFDSNFGNIIFPEIAEDNYAFPLLIKKEICRFMRRKNIISGRISEEAGAPLPCNELYEYLGLDPHITSLDDGYREFRILIGMRIGDCMYTWNRQFRANGCYQEDARGNRSWATFTNHWLDGDWAGDITNPGNDISEEQAVRIQQRPKGLLIVEGFLEQLSEDISHVKKGTVAKEKESNSTMQSSRPIEANSHEQRSDNIEYSGKHAEQSSKMLSSEKGQPMQLQPPKKRPTKRLKSMQTSFEHLTKESGTVLSELETMVKGLPSTQLKIITERLCDIYSSSGNIQQLQACVMGFGAYAPSLAPDSHLPPEAAGPHVPRANLDVAGPRIRVRLSPTVQAPYSHPQTRMDDLLRKRDAARARAHARGEDLKVSPGFLEMESTQAKSFASSTADSAFNMFRKEISNHRAQEEYTSKETKFTRYESQATPRTMNLVQREHCGRDLPSSSKKRPREDTESEEGEVEDS